MMVIQGVGSSKWFFFQFNSILSLKSKVTSTQMWTKNENLVLQNVVAPCSFVQQIAIILILCFSRAVAGPEKDLIPKV